MALEAWLSGGSEGAPDHGRQRAYELLSAARFGFNQALKGWSDNEAAREGLQRALSSMVRYELDVGSARAAAALVAALPIPSEELTRLTEAGAAKTKRAVARLEELEADEDLSKGVRARSFALGGTAAVWLLLGVGMGHLDRSGQWPMRHPEMIAVWIANIIAVLPMIINPGRYLPPTRINLAMLRSAIFLLGAYLSLWVYAWLDGWSVELTLVVNFQIGAVAWGLIALATDRALFITTLAFAVAVLLVPVWPWAKFEIMAFAIAAGVGGSGLVWRIRSLSSDESPNT